LPAGVVSVHVVDFELVTGEVGLEFGLVTGVVERRLADLDGLCEVTGEVVD
jgi:hypothetical protein